MAVVDGNSEYRFGLDGFEAGKSKAFSQPAYNPDSPNIIGYHKNKQGVHPIFGASYLSLEQYLFLNVDFYTNHLQRFAARYLRWEIRLGTFRQKDRTQYMDYYLFWCLVHKKFIVSYLQHYDQATACPDCEEYRLEQIRKAPKL